MFQSEKEFEDALVMALQKKGWEDEVLMNPTIDDLMQNWAKILFDRNRDIDRLNGCPLTETELASLLEEIKKCKTPLECNGFINGKIIPLTRDNPDDRAHVGKTLFLSIFDRQETMAGRVRYQIARQPKFKTDSEILGDYRGDLLLLINGLPVIAIELKSDRVPLHEACKQIEKYHKRNVYSGFLSLVQIFVAMKPNEMCYFANNEEFNPAFFFHWCDFSNEPVNDWQVIVEQFLKFPMAHQLIGFYTVADKTDGKLKVMRSYQIYATQMILERMNAIRMENKKQHGGYIWHTTGSGKTMTSFKAAQLIAENHLADKVIFLIDRIELGTQTFQAYQNLKLDSEDVRDTKNTKQLIEFLKDTKSSLIVTSIQKMSNISEEEVDENQLATIRKKNIVFIIDECHRSTFGEMLRVIKKTFPDATFFGFTGTPIHQENKKKDTITSDIFGDELHRYSIADGMRDKNVLAFDVYQGIVYPDDEVREKIALYKTKSATLEEIFQDKRKEKIYNDIFQMPMEELEKEIPNSQYNNDEYRSIIVKDIIKNWVRLSRNSQFHALFATNSIAEAIEYYALFKKINSDLHVTTLFDPSIDNNDNGILKEEALEEIIQDYNERYQRKYTRATFAEMKRDMALRLAHKGPYRFLKQNERIDILIVVDQMLTGFDSQWINTLYLDKMLQYENIIQAFSRTNRIFKQHEKPFGMIKYYRRPHTMGKNIEQAVRIYSGDKSFGLYVDKLEVNRKKMKEIFAEMIAIFENAGIENLEKLPDDRSACEKFVQLFNEFNKYFEAAQIQGFNWNDEANGEMNEKTFQILAMRYKELISQNPILDSDSDPNREQIPYDIDPYLLTIVQEAIDADYMNSRFKKFILAVDPLEKQKLKNELKKISATYSREDQMYVQEIIQAIDKDELIPDGTKTLQDYLFEWKWRNKKKEIQAVIDRFDLNETLLYKLINLSPQEKNKMNVLGFEELKKSANLAKAKAFFEEQEGKNLIPPKVNMKLDRYLRMFIMNISLPDAKDERTPS